MNGIIVRMRKGLAFVLLILLSLAGCIGFGRGDVQNFIGASLPTNAENVEFKTDQNPTRIVWLTFDTSQNDARIFAANLGIAANLADDVNMTFNYEREAEWWWDGTEGYQGARATLGTKAYQMVIVPMTEETARVYLEVFEY